MRSADDLEDLFSLSAATGFTYNCLIPGSDARKADAGRFPSVRQIAP